MNHFASFTGHTLLPQIYKQEDEQIDIYSWQIVPIYSGSDSAQCQAHKQDNRIGEKGGEAFRLKPDGQEENR